MITSYPATVAPAAAAGAERSTVPAPPVALNDAGSWRYEQCRRSRGFLILAAAVSIGVHVGILFGIGPAKKKVVAARDDNLIAIRLAIPDLKELEEPEPAPTDDSQSTPDLGQLVPMQADVPQLPKPSDFVQQLNFASMIEQPDFSKLNVYVVPEHIRSSGKLAEQIGKIFNLADLDRVPEPVLQPAPQFPLPMRREAQTGRVVIEFVVDTDGRVFDPVVMETSHTGFNDAALSGVSRWKFRPGYKAGRRVATRMRVPILFKFLEPID